MSDRGKSEFQTMDLGSFGTKEVPNDMIIKEFDDITLKETSREHFVKRFLSVPLGKKYLKDPSSEKWSGWPATTAMANDAFKKGAISESRRTMLDDVNMERRSMIKNLDDKIVNHAKNVRNRIGGGSSDLENLRSKRIMDTDTKERNRIDNAFKPNPRPLTDLEKYEKTKLDQDIQRSVNAARKDAVAKNRASFKVVKEFNGDFLNKIFEE